MNYFRDFIEKLTREILFGSAILFILTIPTQDSITNIITRFFDKSPKFPSVVLKKEPPSAEPITNNELIEKLFTEISKINQDNQNTKTSTTLWVALAFALLSTPVTVGLDATVKKYVIKNLVDDKETLKTLQEVLNNSEIKTPIQNLINESNINLIDKLFTSKQGSLVNYLYIVKSIDSLDKFIEQVIKLPKHPKLLDILLESYSADAMKNKFHINSSIYLDFVDQLIGESKEVTTVNITPPYEWFISSPVSLRSDNSTLSIRNYAKKVKEFLGSRSDLILKRITIVDEITALTSIIDHCWDQYSSKVTVLKNEKLSIMSKYSSMDNAYTKDFRAWLEELLVFAKKNILIVDPEYETAKILHESIVKLKSSKDDTSRTNYSETINQYLCETGAKHNDYRNFSSKISNILLRKFKDDYHSQNNEDALYLVKSSLDSSFITHIKDFGKTISILEQEEGVFVSDNQGTFSIKTEEDGNDSILVTLEPLVTSTNPGDTHYNILIESAIKIGDLIP